MKNTLTPSETRLLTRPDLTSARDLFAASCAASREWSDRLASLRKQHGIPEFSAHVSGCGHDSFPEPVKAEMRDLARKVSEYSARAFSYRPARVRLSTMISLSRAVACRDGSGYYGPRV